RYHWCFTLSVLKVKPPSPPHVKKPILYSHLWKILMVTQEVKAGHLLKRVYKLVKY
ncbi:hypothetical protein DBR06_SOUSAS11810007, partial [Sousa chinensis]